MLNTATCTLYWTQFIWIFLRLISAIRPIGDERPSIPRPSTPHEQSEDLEDSASHVESTPSGSDYSATSKEKHHRRKWKNRHRDVSPDTEDEDLEDDRDLEDEAVAEPGVPQSRVVTSKGKGRAVDAPPEDEDINLDKVAAVDSGNKLKRGRWPQVAEDECVELGEKIYKELVLLAKKYGKSVAQVRAKAGLGLVQTRAGNPANAFRALQHAKFPDMKGSKYFSMPLTSEQC